MLKDIISLNVNNTPLLLGVLYASNITVQETPLKLQEKINETISKLTANKDAIKFPPANGTRELLKYGKFRAAGRSKPANEYLLKTVLDGTPFPIVNNIVDINNFISLKHSLPISIFDYDKLTLPLSLRHGFEKESYTFNKAGHEIDLTDLLLVADSKMALGNAIKDRMETKVFDGCKNVIVFAYSNINYITPDMMNSLLNDFEKELIDHAGATDTFKEIFS